MKWKKRLVKEAKLSLPLTEVMKVARLTSPLPDVHRLLSPRPKLRHGRRLAHLSRPNLTLNLYTLFFALLLALLSYLPPLLIFPTVFLPGNRLRYSPIIWDITFPSLSQRVCVTEPEATSLYSAEPSAKRSLTCSSAHPSSPLNFSRLPPTSPRLLPLAQTKLSIPC